MRILIGLKTVKNGVLCKEPGKFSYVVN